MMGAAQSREKRAALRGALYRGDGAAVVAMLAGLPLSGEELQLVGDGLLIALSQGEPGAERLAQECLVALDGRDWAGDDDLAQQLRAVLGSGAAPMLRPLPVDLSDLSTVLEGDSAFGGGRLDLDSGEVSGQAVLEYEQQEMGLEPDGDEGNWLWVDCLGSREAYRDMQDFIATITDPSRADRLGIAIAGRGAFRRFMDVLSRWPDDFTRFHAFAEERQLGRARRWLAGAGYRPQPLKKPAPGEYPPPFGR